MSISFSHEESLGIVLKIAFNIELLRPTIYLTISYRNLFHKIA